MLSGFGCIFIIAAASFLLSCIIGQICHFGDLERDPLYRPFKNSGRKSSADQFFSEDLRAIACADLDEDGFTSQFH
jgi:hypothetical protein